MSATGEISVTLPPRVGRYRVTGLLGRGAMGVVYLGHDAAIDRPVAIKTIHRLLLQGAEGAEWLARFRREVRAAGRCLHPHIVTVFEYGEEKVVRRISSWSMCRAGNCAITSRIASRGPWLTRWRRSSRCCRRSAMPTPAGGALRHQARQHYPAGRWSGKRNDFGIARLDAVGGLTEDGNMAVGMPVTWRPEQFRTEEADARADLYAAAVVLFELLTERGLSPGAALAN